MRTTLSLDDDVFELVRVTTAAVRRIDVEGV